MDSSKQSKEEKRLPLPANESKEPPRDDGSSMSQESRAPLPKPPQQGPPPIDVTGWRLIVLLASVFIGLFLSFLDTTIVSVALTTIADQFDDFQNAQWVITAYLLTYMAFAIIVTRLSDIFGKQAVEVSAFVLFIAFSLGCALSQNMMQLIIFRALQGIGGSALYSMTMVIAISAVPPAKRGLISGVIGIVMVTSGVLGPVLSGAITHDPRTSTWRWIFYLNLPVGSLGLALFVLAWPKHQGGHSVTMAKLLSIDFFGCILLLAGSILLIYSLQEAGADVVSWHSPQIIACLVVSAITLIGFVAWQEYLARHPNLPVKLLFPVGVLRKRVLSAAILVTLMSGFTYYIAVVNLPQRFQIVDRNSPVIAGVKLLPMMVSSAVGSFAAGTINSKRNFLGYTLVVSSCFQVIGYGCMISLGDATPTPNSQFGFQVFLGLGFGVAVTTVTILASRESEPQWAAVTQGALTQMRSLGGSIGLAVAVIVFNNKIRATTALTSVLTPSQTSELLKSPLAISRFTPQEQALVAKVYAKAFTNEMQVATYVAAACFIVSLFAVQRNSSQPALAAPPPAVREAEEAAPEFEKKAVEPV